MSESNGQYDTVIGPDAKFKGELKFEKGVRLLGRFEGQIATKGDLHVAEGGRLQADVEAGNVQVDGHVQGNLAATGKVFLHASAKLEGDLRAARLEVAEGATFVGNCTVGTGSQNKPEADAAPTASAKAPVKGSEPAKTKAGNGQPARSKG